MEQKMPRYAAGAVIEVDGRTVELVEASEQEARKVWRVKVLGGRPGIGGHARYYEQFLTIFGREKKANG